MDETENNAFAGVDTVHLELLKMHVVLQQLIARLTYGIKASSLCTARFSLCASYVYAKISFIKNNFPNQDNW